MMINIILQFHFFPTFMDGGVPTLQYIVENLYCIQGYPHKHFWKVYLIPIHLKVKGKKEAFWLPFFGLNNAN